jgi:hypothetical protein
MGWMIICAAFAVLWIIVGLVRAGKTVLARRKQFERWDVGTISIWLEALSRARTGAWIVFDDRSTNQFVQFRKSSEDRPGAIELVFPRVEWTAPYYWEVEKRAASRGIPVSRIALRSPIAPDEDIHAEFADMSDAAEFTNEVFAEIFNTPNPELHITAEGIDPITPECVEHMKRTHTNRFPISALARTDIQKD